MVFNCFSGDRMGVSYVMDELEFIDSSDKLIHQNLLTDFCVSGTVFSPGDTKMKKAWFWPSKYQ